MGMNSKYPQGLRVMAEYCSSAIWAIHKLPEEGPFRHSMLEHEAVGLPDELAKRFARWLAHYEEQFDSPESFDHERSNAEGRELAAALKRHVGPGIRVVFAPSARGNGRYGSGGPDEEIC
jgi:hypothetical protein